MASNGVRAAFELDGSLYVVAGRVIYRVDQGGTATIIGGCASDGLVTMARNRKATPQIAVVCDGLSQIIESGIVTQITDPDLPPANGVAGIDGYFVFTHPDGQFTLSNIDEGSAIDAADFANAESNADGLLRPIVNGRDLILMGQRSLEVWHNTGDTFPFSRAAAVEYGALSSGGVTLSGDVVSFVTHDGTIRALNGYTPQRISHHAVERSIEDETSPSSITATSWTREGHTFAAFMGTNFSWVYDFATGLWHERRSYGLNRWRVSLVTEFAGQLIAGDYAEPKLYTLDKDTADEAGDPLIWTVQPPTLINYPGRLKINRIDFNVIPGVGTLTETDPQCMLSWSDDGETFGYERTASVGAQGQSQTRVGFSRLGTTRQHGRTYKLSMSADVVKGVLGASIDADAVKF